MYADIRHDFGGNVPSLYNIGGDVKSKFTEDEAVEFFQEDPSAVWINERDARIADKIIFTIPKKSSVFNGKSPVTLYPAGNEYVGIVQDAGEFITSELGAQHVLTFGSILDPAGKPNSRSANPIWFRPKTNTVTIPLNIFGFDPDVIESIEISNLTAGTVRASFNVPGGTIDAIGLDPLIPGRRGAKPLNQTKIEVAGFFTSIEQASSISENLNALSTNKTIQRNIKDNLVFFFIGKTLGDTMLVASAMDTFPGTNISNPYTGLGNSSGQWLDWISGDLVPNPPRILMLKTGDRLNHIRAFIMGVPSILEQQVSKGRTVKQYEFIPGRADPESAKRSILQGYGKLISDTIPSRFDRLKVEFFSCLDETGYSFEETTTFSEEDEIKLTDRSGRAAAGALVRLICGILEALKLRIINWTKNRAVAAAKIPAAGLADLSMNYSSDTEVLLRSIPLTESIFVQKGSVKKLSMKIVISQVPKGDATSKNVPITRSMDLSIRGAFRKLVRGTPDSLARLAGTDVYNRFFVPAYEMGFEWPPVFGPPPSESSQRGGGEDPVEREVQNDLVSYLIGEPESEKEDVETPPTDAFGTITLEVPEDRNPQLVTSEYAALEAELSVPPPPEAPAPVPLPPPPQWGGKRTQTGGGYKITVTDLYTEELVEEIAPTISMLIAYMRLYEVNEYHYYDYINDLVTGDFSDRIADDVLFSSVGEEYVLLQDAGLIVVEEYNNGKRLPIVRGRSTGMTFLFNAFTYAVNARTAEELTDGMGSDLSMEFREMEAGFLSLFGETVLKLRDGYIIKGGIEAPPGTAGAGSGAPVTWSSGAVEGDEDMAGGGGNKPSRRPLYG